MKNITKAFIHNKLPLNETLLPFQKLYNNKKVIVYDFRSDTVTRPTQKMFEAMKAASLLDDVLDEDPSTVLLEQTVAKWTGKESALFCISGTMSNQIGLRLHLRGALESVMLDSRSHIYKYENAGIAYHSQSGVTPLRPSKSLEGKLYITKHLIEHSLIEKDVHCASTKVICLENTLNGSVFPLEEIKKIHKFAKERNLIMHLDGARLWNASVETNLKLEEYCAYFDTISLCLSKGIGAPIGSILVGSNKIMEHARGFRKLFGGGWRQSGILASAALCALENNFNPIEPKKSVLFQDHLNAKWLATELDKINGFKVVNKPVETNMLFVDVRDAVKGGNLTVEKLISAIKDLNRQKVDSGELEGFVHLPEWGYSFDDGSGSKKNDPFVFRLVLHYQIPRKGCEFLVELLKSAVKIISK